MKIISFFIFSCLLSLTVHSQTIDSRQERKALKKTYQIIKILDIKVRPNVSKDSSLRFLVDPRKFALNATFVIYGRRSVIYDLSDSLRFYLKPTIVLSPLERDILNKSKDTTEKIYCKAIGIIIHELTHYLQVAYDNDYYYPASGSADDMRRNISQNTEFEAWSVESYFFLSKFYKKDLRKIMKSHIQMNIKMEMLIDEYYAKVYPWRKGIIFPISS